MTYAVTCGGTLIAAIVIGVAARMIAKGSIRKTAKKPTAGSGGRVKRGLEGRGPPPKAKDRPYHQAHKAAKRAERDKTTKPRRRTGLAAVAVCV